MTMHQGASAGSTHALYRFFDADDVLLYIGITHDVPARFRAHRKGKPWWTTVTRIAIEPFPDRESVLRAELRAIASERPRWNIQHNTTSRPDIIPAASATSTDLALVCTTCGAPFHPSNGVVHVNMTTVMAAERAERSWEAAQAHASGYDLSTLEHWPMPVGWRIECDDCLDEDCDACYSFAASECCTWVQLLAWTAHLSEKSWLSVTNWMPLVRAVALGVSDAGFVVGQSVEKGHTT